MKWGRKRVLEKKMGVCRIQRFRMKKMNDEYMIKMILIMMIL